MVRTELGARSFDFSRMMDGNGNTGGGLMESQVDLDDNINFWASFGGSPHVIDSEHPIHHEQPLEQQMEFSEQPLRRELCAVEVDPRIDPFVGMEFDSGEAAKTFYIAYAGKVGFSVRIARSRRSKCSESVIMLRFVCSKEGFSREKRIVAGKKTRKRAASIREGCKAMLEVIRRGDEKWVVTKLVKEHNHEVGMPSKVHYIATECDAELMPYVGMEFESLEVAKTFYYAYASRVGFEARVRQSRRSLHDETLKMLKLVCSKHRYHSGRDENGDEGRKGSIHEPSKEGCNALFEIVRKDGDVWMVSKLELEHTHELAPSPPCKVRCVRSQGEILVIAKNFSDTRNLLLSGQDSQIYPREIRYNDLGPDDANNLLEHFKRTQTENPAFFYSVQCGQSNCMTNILWADAKARMAYHYFGDAITFDMTYKSDKDFMPLVMFTGVNHHLQPVVFGFGFLVDESEASFVWLFEQWLKAMFSRPPVSLITILSWAIAAAVSKVFPSTRHFFCRRHILRTIMEELSDLCSTHPVFIEELTGCVEESTTMESFESCWNVILEKYDLGNNAYLRSLYGIRDKWVPLFLKDTFCVQVSQSQRSEAFDKIIEKYCTSKTPLKVAVRQLGQALANNYEKEAQEDYVTMFDKPFLRTASPIEKQAANIYTRTMFDRFREEFIESLGYHVEKIEDGAVSKYQVARNETTEGTFIVTFDASDRKVHCSCCMFEAWGLLCRHALRLFIIVGVRILPKDYILKRWTKHAKGSSLSEELGFEIRSNGEEPSASRYNDLCHDAIRCAKEGAASAEVYSVAKEAFQRALAEIISAKQKRGEQTLQSLKKAQKKNPRRPGKATPKKDVSNNKTSKGTASPEENDYI
ncbi:hypothetical protein HPP92_002186 [Vanilla planifolia]|uniref:Protein FAR1-RELATED SEQUENCE n=1 Tax=Vanilla planifolia TaxID=51239 RepID=A0A835S147_VANPL|nr:hypothetical protein HPP92_002186 [Vanilla planifolia]